MAAHLEGLLHKLVLGAQDVQINLQPSYGVVQQTKLCSSLDEANGTIHAIWSMGLQTLGLAISTYSEMKWCGECDMLLLC